MQRYFIDNASEKGAAGLAPVSFFLLVLLFLSELIFARLQGDADTSRMMLILISIDRVIILSVLLLTYLARLAARRTNRNKIFDSLTIFWFAAFILVSCIGGAAGLMRGNIFQYAAGDLFKFIIFPVTILIVGSNMKKTRFLNRLILAMAVLYTIYLICLIYMYVSGVYKRMDRPSSIYIFPLMLPLLFYLKSIFRMPKVFSMVIVFYLVSAPLLVWYAQSLSLVLQLTFIPFMTLAFYKGLSRRVKVAFLLVTVLVLGIVYSVAVSPKAFFGLLDSIASPGSYLTKKFYSMSKYAFSLKTLELIGGDRLAQGKFIMDYFSRNPAELMTGQGMGGFIRNVSLFGENNASWRELNHYIEGGFLEVLYRSGIFGLLCYFSIFVSLFIKAYQWRRKNLFCAFAAAYASYILIFSTLLTEFVGQLTGSLFMITILYTGTLLMNREYRREAYQAQAFALERSHTSKCAGMNLSNT